MPGVTEDRPAHLDVQIAPATRSGEAHITDLAKKMADLNKGKLPPRIPREIRDESRRTQVYIWNIGPRRHEFSLASMGAWNWLEPCLPKEEFEAMRAKQRAEGLTGHEQYVEIAPGEFAKPFMIPGIPYEPVWREGNRAEAQFYGQEDEEDTGYKLALSAIGIGRNQKRDKSLEKFGVFVSRTSPPLAGEVAAAKKKLMASFAADVAEANEAHKMGRFLGERGIAADYHYQAAKALNKTARECPWLDETAESASTASCQFCGVPVKPGLPKCPNCKEIIDPEAYEKAQAKAAKKKA